jgi:hypothetical protein
VGDRFGLGRVFLECWAEDLFRWAFYLVPI